MNNNDETQQLFLLLAGVSLLVPGALTYVGDYATFKLSHPSVFLQALSTPVIGSYLLLGNRVYALVASFFFWLVLLGILVSIVWKKLARPYIERSQIESAVKDEQRQETLLNDARQKIRGGQG